MYAAENRVERNQFDRNMVGVFLMYSNGVELRGNRISGCVGPTGMGIGFKESSQVLVQDNAIIYCGRGIYLDVSPYEPDTINRFLGNQIAYNGVGIVFHNDWHSNVFRDNIFEGNFTQVGVHGGGGATRHVWEGNHWDDYQGFDRNHDGRGDTPYQLNAYSDRIWMQVPAASFFRGSLLFEVIDFLDRLAPFTEPTTIVRDLAPRLVASE
jgi:nitrous oxidase accessory protein